MQGIVQTLARARRSVIVTIPISSGDGAQLKALASLTDAEVKTCIGCRIRPKQVDAATDRPAFLTSAVAGMTNPDPVAAGVEWMEPIPNGADEFVRSTGAAFNAVAIFYFQ